MDQIFCDVTWSDWAKNKIVTQLKDSYIFKFLAISFLSLFVIVLKSFRICPSTLYLLSNSVLSWSTNFPSLCHSPRAYAGGFLMGAREVLIFFTQILFFLRGLGRSWILFLSLQILFFCDLKLNVKLHNSRTTPSRRKVCGTEEENSASADGGPRSKVCARLTLHSAPHQH